jgi:hypothetical protein
MTIISYVKDKKLIKQKFIENREYKIEELMNYIKILKYISIKQHHNIKRSVIGIA